MGAFRMGEETRSPCHGPWVGIFEVGGGGPLHKPFHGCRVVELGGLVGSLNSLEPELDWPWPWPSNTFIREGVSTPPMPPMGWTLSLRLDHIVAGPGGFFGDYPVTANGWQPNSTVELPPPWRPLC